MMDKTLSCRDCGANFTFTASEQEFFASKGFTNEPSRCPSCRAARKQGQGRDSGGYSSGGGYSTSGFGGGYDRRERQMFPAVCASCGRQTEVPFQPRGDRPVYCSDCFRSRQPSTSASRRW
jgi:CxxC-x17-CxxC domain-containing protein